MCILFLYVDPDPPSGSFRLIAASNRDEFYDRESKNAYVCPETKIIGGRDMTPGREGGMWLGITTNKPRSIRLGALLNVTGEERLQGAAARGPLVYDYLKGDTPFPEYVQNLPLSEFNAFTLVGVEINDENSTIYHQSNAPQTYTKFEGTKKILGISNSTLASPFTKVKNGVQRFAEVIESDGTFSNKEKLTEKLFELLKWDKRHLPDVELQRRAPDSFEYRSPIFVRIVPAAYGTRTHSIILVDRDWNVEYHESSIKQPIDAEKPEWENSRFKCQL